MPEPGRPVPSLVPAPEEIQEGYALPCQTLKLGGAEVRLFTVPEGSSQADRTVVCLPGLGASGRSFAPMRALARDLRLLLWTPPFQTPLGISPLDLNLSLLSHPAAPLPEKFVLLGSSYGSLLALAFALAFPERIHALVLVSPVASTRRIRRGALLASAFLRVPLPLAYLFAPVVARALGGPHLPHEARAEIIREARRLTPLELARRLKDILASDFLPKLGAFQVPTLVVHGSRDLIVPLSAARDVAEKLPNARLEVIRGAAHLPYMSHVAAFNDAVGPFIESILDSQAQPLGQESHS